MTPPDHHSLVRVGQQDQFPEVGLIEPSAHGFVVLAAEIDRRFGPTFAFESRVRKRLIRGAKAAAAVLSSDPMTVEARVFSAILAPPGGEGRFLGRHPEVHRAAFDLVMLVEAATPAHARRLRSSESFRALETDLAAAARHLECFTAINVRRIAPVEHELGGVFLFNYFFAEEVRQNLEVWQYTAGWFQDQTGLDNSCVLQPDPDSDTAYTLVNHCRWNSLLEVMPSLLLKPSFRSYVLAHFEANRTAPMPILYRLA